MVLSICAPPLENRHMGRNMRIPGPPSTKAPAHTAILYLSLLISKSDVILVFICFFNEATSINTTHQTL